MARNPKFDRDDWKYIRDSLLGQRREKARRERIKGFVKILSVFLVVVAIVSTGHWEMFLAVAIVLLQGLFEWLHAVFAAPALAMAYLSQRRK